MQIHSIQSVRLRRPKFANKNDVIRTLLGRWHQEGYQKIIAAQNLHPFTH